MKNSYRPVQIADGSWYRVKGYTRHGLVCGSYYLHDEDYKGRQGNGHWRGIVVLNEVSNGSFDIMPLSIEYMRKKYG